MICVAQRFKYDLVYTYQGNARYQPKYFNFSENE